MAEGVGAVWEQKSGEAVAGGDGLEKACKARGSAMDVAAIRRDLTDETMTATCGHMWGPLHDCQIR